MVVKKIVRQIMTLGFSENEAKAYVSLVKIQPGTAYELSRDSGIPSSKIYEVIARLVEKNVFLLVMERGKKKYVPVPPDEFIDRNKSAFDSTFNQLKQDLPKVKKAEGVSFVWNIYEYEYLLDKAKRMIIAAEDTLLISLCREEFTHLEKAIVQAEKRGVNVAIVHFGIPQTSVGQLFQHPIEDTLYLEKGGRGFTLVSDSNTALFGTITNELGVEGAWSKSLGFVTLAEDYIKHDIYIMKIVKRFDTKLKGVFGEGYARLRDIFSDKEEE